MTTPHIDLVVIGSETINVVGRPFTATGIALPPAGADALVLRVDAPANAGGDVTTAVFGEMRLLNLEHAAAGDQPTDANSLSLEKLSVVAFAGAVGTVIGVTDAAEGQPFGELLIGGFNVGAEISVTLWHFEPAGVDLDSLDASLVARVLPQPTAAQARYRVAVNADGSGYTLVGADEAGDSGVTDEMLIYELALRVAGQAPAADSNEAGRVTRLRRVATAYVNQRLPSATGAPAEIRDECVIRLVVHLWSDRDSVDERRNLAAAWLYAGCGMLTAPWLPIRAGALE